MNPGERILRHENPCKSRVGSCRYPSGNSVTSMNSLDRNAPLPFVDSRVLSLYGKFESGVYKALS
jgi:hypothetical protein